MTTQPTDDNTVHSAPHILVPAAYEDKRTGVVYVHHDLDQALNWRDPQYIGPPNVTQRFGDVRSWAAYVSKYGEVDTTLALWSTDFFSAALDYHQSEGLPGRCQWWALYKLEKAESWLHWTRLGDGRSRTPIEIITAIEERQDEVAEPSGAELIKILRILRASVTTDAETQINDDGTTEVKFARADRVAGGEALPMWVKVATRVIDGEPGVVVLPLRLTVTVDDNARLRLSLKAIGVNDAFETQVQELVKQATTLLGAEYELFHGA